jgi:hypothetical protein
MIRTALLCLGLLTASATTPAFARSHDFHHHFTHSYGPSEGRHYTNVDGNSVHSPIASDRAPSGASAHCSDGSWSFSQHHSGTCSHHGGVAGWL